MPDFELISSFEPAGDQPAAIEQLTRNLATGDRHNVLLGVTGSGKTFTMAKVVSRSFMPPAAFMPTLDGSAARIIFIFSTMAPS